MATFQVGEIAIVHTPDTAPQLHNRLCEITRPFGCYHGIDDAGYPGYCLGYCIHIVGDQGERAVEPKHLRKLGEAGPELLVPREELADA